MVVVAASELDDEAKLGIPEPELLDEPGVGWRGRFFGQRWQVNAGHEDFAALAGDAKARLRYLLTLLAEEIVARTHGGPGGPTPQRCGLQIQVTKCNPSARARHPTPRASPTTRRCGRAMRGRRRPRQR